MIQVDKESSGNNFTLHLGDKNLILQKDKEGNWSLHADKKEVSKYQINTSFKNSKNYSVVYRKKGDKDDKNVYVVIAPKIHIKTFEKPHAVVKIHIPPKIVTSDKMFDIFVRGEEDKTKKIEIAPHFDSENKNKYEEIVKKLKKDLPEGYTVESIIDEEAGILQ